MSDPAAGLPRLSLAKLPTPVEEAPRLAAALGLARLWVKREDLSGTALGGNKLRQLDVLLAEALAQGADTVVATAGSQSNFCRALAGACARTGLACHLHLRDTGGRRLQGNLLLGQVFGAQATFTGATDPWDPAIRAEMDAIMENLRAAGRRPSLVQLTGDSAALADAAWVSGAAEVVRDFGGAEAVPSAVAVACGSGLTLAGLLLGFRYLGVPARLVGFSVQQPASRLVTWIADVIDRTSRLLGISVPVGPADIVVRDHQVAPGYGLPSAASVAAVRLAGRTEGLVLDPVYTGKALAGFAQDARALAGSRGTALFLHSGGTPGLFHHAEAFA